MRRISLTLPEVLRMVAEMSGCGHPDGMFRPEEASIRVECSATGPPRVVIEIGGERPGRRLVQTGYERTPAGTINNCSLANGEEEATCQICKGTCPDRARFREVDRE